MDFVLAEKQKTGLKPKARLIAGLLLVLSLPRCSALHKKSLSEEKTFPAPEGSFEEASRKLSAASPRLSQKRFSAEKSAFADPKVLDELYDRFVTEVDFEIREGLARKDQKRVLSGLRNLQRLLPQPQERAGGFQLPGPGEKEALTALERANALLDNNLMIFSEGNPSRADYWRAAADYKSLMDGASKYLTASARHDEILQGLLRRKSQTAGAGFMQAGFAAAAGIAALVIWLGKRGAEDEHLTEALAAVRETLQTCSNSAPVLAAAYTAYKDSGDLASLNMRHQEVLRNLFYFRSVWNFLFYRSRHLKLEEIFCSQSSHSIDDYEDIFGDVSRLWGRGELCESIGASSKEDCFFRKWLCENTKKLKRCLQDKNIQIKWLSSEQRG